MKKNQLYSWMHPDLEVLTTRKYGHSVQPIIDISGNKKYTKKDGEGFGIYAKKDIKKNTIMFVMGGYILDIQDENNLRGIVADKPIEISDEFSIGPRKPSDIAKMPQHYINHSCDPNCGFKGQLFIISLKSIKAGDELVYDYAMIMHPNKNSDSTFTFNCVCGSKKCRHVISERDWERSDLQARYDGYFQWYLQEKIDKRNNK